MNFIENMKQRARNEIKKIVLPEASDLRTIKAAAIALEEKYAELEKHFPLAYLDDGTENTKKYMNVKKEKIICPLNLA